MQGTVNHWSDLILLPPMPKHQSYADCSGQHVTASECSCLRFAQVATMTREIAARQLHVFRVHLTNVVRVHLQSTDSDGVTHLMLNGAPVLEWSAGAALTLWDRRYARLLRRYRCNIYLYYAPTDGLGFSYPGGFRTASAMQQPTRSGRCSA